MVTIITALKPRANPLTTLKPLTKVPEVRGMTTSKPSLNEEEIKNEHDDKTPIEFLALLATSEKVLEPKTSPTTGKSIEGKVFTSQGDVTKTTKATPAHMRDNEEQKPNKRDAITKTTTAHPHSKSDTTTKHPGKSDVTTKHPGKADVTTKHPGKTDVTKYAGKAEVTTKHPGKAEVTTTKHPGKANVGPVTTKQPGKFDIKIDTTSKAPVKFANLPTTKKPE
uniref:Uncharacterized protein n=1 Tax=Strigamia maritima TaxID=126957 RepID=T1J2S2_STRMM